MPGSRKLIMVCISFWIAGCLAPYESTSPFEQGRSLGTNKNHKLEEPSGLVASITNPGLLWTHNDGGNPAQLFLLDTMARTKKVFTLANIKNRDWEDITLGPCADQNTPCIFIGDIGDNLAQYPLKYIYSFKEPSLNDPEQIEVFDTLVVKLSDGARDTEAMMIDPVSRNLYLVSKREKEVMLYEVASPFLADTLIAKKVLTFSLHEIVAGNISPDGKEVLLKNYRKIYYWKKKGNESLVELLKSAPVHLAYEPEPQGESIAWASDGSGYYTLSENAKGERGKLYFYKRK